MSNRLDAQQTSKCGQIHSFVVHVNEIFFLRGKRIGRVHPPENLMGKRKFCRLSAQLSILSMETLWISVIFDDFAEINGPSQIFHFIFMIWFNEKDKKKNGSNLQ